ncbi:MAG: ACP S-malonyltransferase, partial [Desulfovibrionaceae bacterium]|nr:ACP S-malonyltransferase [Desulfovibrionaceae bacterium]
MHNAVLLFPGQGCQGPQMGRDLAEADQDSMDLWKKAEKISGLPLREVYWEKEEASQNDTKFVQPALVCVQVNFWRKLKDKVKAIAASGHSLGEYSALACAKVLSLDEALMLTSLRGRLMSEADLDGKGAMAAIVKLEREVVSKLVEEVKAETNELILLANFNTPKQIVLSGTKKAIDLACTKAKALKGRGVVLKVSAAFHSPMMQEANVEFTKVLAKATWRDAEFPIFGNIDGQKESLGEALHKKMQQQMVSPVLWVDTILEEYAFGARTWLEIGPKS